MITLVISGGQTGADQAGWRAARAAGLETGGWMPRGFLAESGNHPEFAEMYGAKEHPSPNYPPRTEANVRGSDATIVFSTDEKSRGTVATCKAAYRHEKPNVVVKVSPADLNPAKIEMVRPMAMAEWLAKHNIKTLNVAGNRESLSPGIGEFVERYMGHVFRLIKIAEGIDL